MTFEDLKIDWPASEDDEERKWHGAGIWYTSGIEAFISTMETSSLMGKNVARLVLDGWEMEKEEARAEAFKNVEWGCGGGGEPNGWEDLRWESEQAKSEGEEAREEVKGEWKEVKQDWEDVRQEAKEASDEASRKWKEAWEEVQRKWEEAKFRWRKGWK